MASHAARLFAERAAGGSPAATLPKRARGERRRTTVYGRAFHFKDPEIRCAGRRVGPRIPHAATELKRAGSTAAVGDRCTPFGPDPPRCYGVEARGFVTSAETRFTLRGAAARASASTRPNRPRPNHISHAGGRLRILRRLARGSSGILTRRFGLRRRAFGGARSRSLRPRRIRRKCSRPRSASDLRSRRSSTERGVSRGGRTAPGRQSRRDRAIS